MIKAIVKAVVITALLACAPNLVPDRDKDPAAIRQQSGNVVLYDHEDVCWSGMEKAHVDVPTHVVMRIEGGTHKGHWFYGGPAYTHLALVDVFEKDNPRVFVLAFCE